jgi:hypothetical protein
MRVTLYLGCGSMVKAFLYSRVSSASQADGTGIDRQEQRGLEYYNRVIAPTGIALDNEIHSDSGRSAFSGKNLNEDGALRKILDEIKTGRIEAGSILICENLDRISRQGPKLARQTLAKITDCGVQIHVLPNLILKRNWENIPAQSIPVDLEIDRAHSESSYKSERVSAAWTTKKANALKEVLSKTVPLWLTVDSREYSSAGKIINAGTIVEIPEKVAAIREAFRLAGLGIGLKLIKLKVPGLGSHSWLSNVFNSRCVLGEYQPTKKVNGKRVPDGQPVLDYFPAIITQSEWDAVRTQLSAKVRNGHFGGCNNRSDIAKNLFTSLIFDVSSKPERTFHFHQAQRAAYIVTDYPDHADPRSQVRINYHRFEYKFLDYLYKLDWRTIANQSKSPEQEIIEKKLEIVRSEIATVSRRINMNEAAMDSADIEAAELRILARKLSNDESAVTTLKTDLDKLEAELSAVKGRSESLENVDELKEAIQNPTNNDVRLRCRAEIRKRVSRIEVIKNAKICQATIQFVNGIRKVVDLDGAILAS